MVVEGSRPPAATSPRSAPITSWRGETALVGSIGVLFQYPNLSDLFKTIGVKVETDQVVAAQGGASGFEPTSPEARKAVEEIVMDSYAWFKDLVQKRRNLDDATLAKVSDGRVFTGRQGLALKLVDELGGERAAIAWLAKEKKIDPKTPVRDYRLRDASATCRSCTPRRSRLLDGVGLGSIARRFEELGAVQAIERLNLDGLLALWHPPSAN